MAEPNLPPTPDSSWKRRPGGLYVPRESHVPPAVASAERGHKLTDWLQGIGTMVAAVIAALALLVGALTLQDQQQINEVTRERAERRYVERVAWWIEETGKSHVIHIQNRSPVRLLDVEALYRPIDTADDRLGVAQFEQMILPCTMVGYELVLLDGDHRDEKIWPVVSEGADTRFLVNDPPSGWTLRLHDSYGGWDFPFDGSPRPISDNRTPFQIYRSALLKKPKYQREIADCSEGG